MLHILHFNDVYNVTETKKCGGASKFMTTINKFKPLNPLILFSGDFLSPSNMSTVTKGEHMIPIMNKFGIHCGMIGNHDLDYGNEHCIKCLSKLNYPTLNTNIFTPISNNTTNNNYNYDENELEPLGKCEKYKILNHNGFRIGLIGIAEDWSNTLCSQPVNGIIYINYIKQCAKYVNKLKLLKQQNKIDMIIVLTHSRLQNDIILANNIKDIDLILGGHDHLYHVELNKYNKSLLVKSGCDFKGITYIQMVKKQQNYNFNNDMSSKIVSELNKNCLHEKKENLIGINYIFCTFHYKINEYISRDVSMTKLISNLSGSFLTKISKPIGYVNNELESRFKVIRVGEANSCNLICDIVRSAYKVDGVILCGGGIRSDRIHDAGIITFKDILDLVPFQDPIIVKMVSGKNILNAIEHSIHNLPKLDGRFAHVSGIKYVYDSRKQPGKRLTRCQINKYNNNNNYEYEEIDSNKEYSIASRAYTMNGGDGFTSFKDLNNKMIVDWDSGLSLSTLMRNFFWSIQTINNAIKLSSNSNNQMFLQNINKLLGKLNIKQNSDNDIASLLYIEPKIEGRIIDLASNINNKMQIITSMRYDKLPSYVNMTEKPRTNQNIIQFIDDIVDD